MSSVIQIIGRVDGVLTRYDNQYIVSYDVDKHGEDRDYYGGELITTPHKASAQVFADAAKAMELWKSQPTCTCHMTRVQDGKPNRPLTAYHVNVHPL